MPRSDGTLLGNRAAYTACFFLAALLLAAPSAMANYPPAAGQRAEPSAHWQRHSGAALGRLAEQSTPSHSGATSDTAVAPSLRHLAMTVACNNVLPQTNSTTGIVTSYGNVPANGTFYYCTSATGSSYNNSAFQTSLHTAPPGYRVALAITQWCTESWLDFGTIYLTQRGVLPSASSTCGLSEASSGGISLFSGGDTGAYAGTPAGSPVFGLYGGGAGLCFFSDSSEVLDGIGYSVTAQACPSGFFCPNNALSPIPCTAVRMVSPTPQL